jgi:plastocyanin
MLRVTALCVLLCALAAGPAAASERTVVLRSRPFTVPAFATVKPKVDVPTPRVDGYITDMTARLVDLRGRPTSIRRVMLHHVVFIKRGYFPQDREPKCGAGRRGQPIYGTGEERQRLDLPAGYGYRVRPRDRWRMQTMLMGHHLGSDRVRVEYRMRVVTGRRLTPVTPYWVTVTDCANEPSYSIPGGGAPGSVAERVNRWRVPRSGRIVAAVQVRAGGALRFGLSQPRCGGRALVDTRPFYGMPDDLVYRLTPMLHEPGPVGTTWVTSRAGIPVRRHEYLDVVARYDGELPHNGVMAVMHVYVAPPARRAAGGRAPCPALPGDVRGARPAGPVRTAPPRVHIPLSAFVGGRVRPIAHPTGRAVTYPDGARPQVAIRAGRFSPVTLSVASRTTVTWRFLDREPHKVSLANGPRAMGSGTYGRGATWKAYFGVPGTYQLFCPLHPLTMHQEVNVRGAGQ